MNHSAVKAHGPERRGVEPPPARLVGGAPHPKGNLTMNRNVTIGLGTLIIIIIVVALVF